MASCNGIGWFEIGTDAPAAAERFYGGLFGWTFADDPGSTAADGSAYRLVTPPGAARPGGGVSATGGATPGWAIFYVVVPDTAQTCRDATAAGGKVLVGPRTDASGLTSAQLLDPAGNRFGVFTPPGSEAEVGQELPSGLS